MKISDKLIFVFILTVSFLLCGKVSAEIKEKDTTINTSNSKPASTDENDPEMAEFFWNKYNSGVSDGKIIIKRYKREKRKYPYPLGDGFKDGNIIYTTNYRGPVVGYDTKSDEFFIVFYPNNIHRYPTMLKKAGVYLIIGTRGDGVIIINVENFYLKKYGINSNDGIVENIEIKDSKIIINSSYVIDMPAF